MNWVLLVLAVPAVFSCGYLLLMSLLSARLKIPAPTAQQMRFDVIVPAHDEAAVIGRVVESLTKLAWPRDRYRILVVADNCSDATAQLARDAGAEVLERQHATLRGKGYALRHAFEFSLADGRADAVVILDADSVASPNLLEAFASRLEAGADAVQVHYGILNPNDSWRTRLMTIAMASFHIVRSRARERMGVSCGIRGNGWCLHHRLLRRSPYNAFSITEDLEYGINLGLAGTRVWYADEARVDADMVSNVQASGTQRHRWEGGRFELLRTQTLPLLAAAVKQRSGICADLAADLLVLPLSYVALNAGLLFVVAAAATAWNAEYQGWLWTGLGCVAALVLYVMRGWALSGTGLQGLLDLARAPFFIFWKIVVVLRRHSGEWVRTERESGKP